MPNGMENDKINYNVTLGNESHAKLQDILELYAKLFEDADLNFFKKRYASHPKLISILAYDNETLVGFKIGYPYNEITFYSWIGGVLPKYRQQSIAHLLAEYQESVAKSQGFKILRTKSMNRFKPMMILNLKRGFNITNIYTNTKEQTKIVFEKLLTD